MSRVKNIFRGNAGFTLIELLIVIVIIGILAAVAIPNILGLTGTADRNAVEQEMRQLITELEADRATNPNRRYTESTDDIASLTGEDFRAANSLLDREADGEITLGGSVQTTSYTVTASGDGWTVTISSADGFSTTNN